MLAEGNTMVHSTMKKVYTQQLKSNIIALSNMGDILRHLAGIAFITATEVNRNEELR